ncbi:Phosphate/pyrophosphate-specific outer membrane porin OprP/OprO [hydrothermal vent metagenome]|uniref:Phosphate/pyrophosphate-specific outer membrane porin OprP/OprO n=1 Tax=hydrothermal vent metagenome TaxID=652676 RepID=A0A3B1DWI5_9ZZZZ
MSIKWNAAIAAGLFTLAVTTGMPKVSAQEPARIPEIQQLMQRLENAESQIGQLQNQLQQTEGAAVVQVPSNSSGIEQVGATDSKELERIKNLESNVDKILGRFSKGTNWISPGHSGSTMKVFGRIHADYWSFPEDSDGVRAFEGGDPQSRIGFRRMRIGVKGDIKDNMFYKIEVDFAARNRTAFKDAYLGFKDIPFFQKVIIGQQKRPYGLDTLNSSRYNVFIERPFVVEALNQDARRFGIASHGVSEDLAWNWQYGFYNQRDLATQVNDINDHFQGQFAGRLANTIWYDESSGGRGYAHWAISGTVANSDGNSPNNGTQDNETRFRTRPEARTSGRWLNTGRIAGAKSYEILAAEAVVNVGSVQAVGEFMNVWVQRESVAGEDVQFYGAYGYVSWFLTGEHIPWNRKTGTIGRVKPFQNFFLVDTCDDCKGRGWGAWQVAARYSYSDFSDADILGGKGESLTIGVNWHWNPYARMQFNYIDGRISNRSVNGQTAGNYQVLGVRMMVDF